MLRGNLFHPSPYNPDEEFSEVLTRAQGSTELRRIVSRGHASPPGFWYDQPETEWVALLSGRATLEFENEPSARHLQPGDWLVIPAHQRHRIEATSTEEDCVWIALHFDECPSKSSPTGV